MAKYAHHPVKRKSIVFMVVHASCTMTAATKVLEFSVLIWAWRVERQARLTLADGMEVIVGDP